MRARACIKCRQYVEVDPVDPVNQNLIKTFEGQHRGHTLITLDIDEVKSRYEKYTGDEES